jgi:hypothetical protein
MKKILSTFKKKINKDVKHLTEKLLYKLKIKDRISAQRILNKILNKKFKKLSQPYKLFIKDVICKLYYREFNRFKYNEVQNQLISMTENLDFSLFDTNEWLDLQFFLLRFGLFQIAEITRIKAIDKAYENAKDKHKDKTHITLAFSAAVEQGDFNFAKNLIKKAENLVEQNLYNKMLFYYILSSGKDLSAFNFEKHSFNEIDQKYFDYIIGKSVAIVGPSPVSNKQGEEIDSYDIVIRLGYKGHEQLPNPVIFGSKTDISYYSNGNARNYIVNKRSHFLKDLKWAVFKSQEYLNHADEIKLDRRRCFFKNKFYFCGSPTMMQNSTFDILHFKPKKVKLFNLNFNLSKKTHYKSYHPSKNLKHVASKKKYLKLWPEQIINTLGLAHHDFVSQIHFIRNLLQNKRIEVDDECGKVLNMSNRDYLREMEKIHILPFLGKQ